MSETNNTTLVTYEAARHALQVCVSIDDAKNIKDKVEALKAYAKQTNDIDMEIWLAEIKFRAEARIGEISREIPKALPTSGQSHTKSKVLENAGISRGTASRCEKVADIPEEKREQIIAEAKENKKPISTKKVLSEKKTKAKKANVVKQEIEIANTELPVLSRKYHVISIDPPWPYENGKQNTYDADSRRVANPYPEMSIEQIGEIQIPSDDDCVLWLWTTHRFLPDSFELLKEWGFTYKATMVWDKEKIGMGHWLRMQCEFCLLAIKGNPVWENTTVRDIISSPRREHSRKPDEFFEMVDDICVGAKLEYFSREKREGWDTFGNDTDKF